MAMQQIEVTFNDDGTANVKLPDGKNMRVADPAKLAKLTEDIAKAMGKIVERHAAHSHIVLTDKGYVSEDHVHE